MATHAPTTGARPCAPFNPADWLAQFETVGGGYTLTDTRFSLMYQIDGRPADDQRRASGMIADLTESDRASLVALLRGRV